MATPPPAVLEVEEHRYGWVMVAVTFLLSVLAFGGLPAVAVFIKPLTLEFGWSRGETSLGYTVTALSAALAGLGFGVLADRFGTRAIALLGVLGMGAAYMLQSGQSTLTELYLTYILFGATGVAVVSGPLLIEVGFWFGRNKGLAIGIVASGGGVGQGAVPRAVPVADRYRRLARCALLAEHPLFRCRRAAGTSGARPAGAQRGAGRQHREERRCPGQRADPKSDRSRGEGSDRLAGRGRLLLLHLHGGSDRPCRPDDD